MERIDEGQLFNVIVDFAHTPDGLEKVFEYAKSITEEGHAIISVFGSAGKRDTKKRKVFGEIADRYCERMIHVMKIQEISPMKSKAVLNTPITFLLKIAMQQFVRLLKVPMLAIRY